MRNIPILITLALLAASCGDPGGSGGSTPESIAARCKASELADQCPLGSRPVVEASVCSADQRYVIDRDEPRDRKHALRINLVEPTPERTRPPQINPE